MADEMFIGAPRVIDTDGCITYSSRIRLPGEEFEMWFRGPSDVLRPRGADAFLIVCLTTAMERGLPLVVEAPVSPRLLAAACSTVQDIFHCWYPELVKVAIHAESRRVGPIPDTGGAASFFSGGVDSFFTAYKHLDEISMLVLVHGFDLPLQNTALRAKVAASIAKAAEGLGKPLIEIETNCRELTDRLVSWPDHQFGAALASVAVLLGDGVRKVFIPASLSFAQLDPNGSHSLLDPLWSTEETEIVHDGAEASRNDKAALLAQHPESLPFLRVCWENPEDAYNCGRCEKCIRTMINLEIAGALDACDAFNATLDPQVVSEMPIENQHVFHLAVDNLTLLRAQGRNPALIRALQKSVDSYQADTTAKQLLALSWGDWGRLADAAVRHIVFRARRKIRHILSLG